MVGMGYAGEEESMKLYVGNLPYTTTDDELRELFQAHGTLTSAKVVVDNQSGRSRGFGFVEFESHEAGKEAIAALNNKEVGGRRLVVNEARSQASGSDRGGPRRGPGGGGHGRSEHREGRGFGGGRRGY